MLTTDKKKFADELRGIVESIESGLATFHSLQIEPISIIDKDGGPFGFSRFGGLEYTIRIRSTEKMAKYDYSSPHAGLKSAGKGRGWQK